ncbi:MAG: hypothetical protein ACRCWM_03245 [Sarcina sp.]
MKKEILDNKRVELGFSIRKVALNAGVSYAATYDVFKTEGYKPRLETVKKIIGVLNLQIGDIF